mgnify:CR=1 FL=1
MNVSDVFLFGTTAGNNLDSRTFVPQARATRVPATTDISLWVLSPVPVMMTFSGAIAPFVMVVAFAHKREGVH